MEFPQDILDKFMVREDYLQWIGQETAIYVYLDLTNMFHWQDVASSISNCTTSVNLEGYGTQAVERGRA